MASKADYFFGEVVGQPVGSKYPSRQAAMRAGIHNTAMQGISGNATVGANCIVLNKGYRDDEDHGDWILYTGAGGNDTGSGRQIADQEITHNHNAALVLSEENGLPVRVLRGFKGDPLYAPSEGYRYDGLFKVVRHWAEQGVDGFRIWRFHLARLTTEEAAAWTPSEQGTEARQDIPNAANAGDEGVAPPAGTLDPGRAAGLVQRIVRSTPVSQWVKRAHDFKCQVCGESVSLPIGAYVEGAHIRALGAPHRGPDTPDNVLCLCPNHHVAFDGGGIFVDGEMTVRTHAGRVIGPLRVVSDHVIDEAQLAYHRTHHGLI